MSNEYNSDFRNSYYFHILRDSFALKELRQALKNGYTKIIVGEGEFTKPWYKLSPSRAKIFIALYNPNQRFRKYLIYEKIEHNLLGVKVSYDFHSFKKSVRGVNRYIKRNKIKHSKLENLSEVIMAFSNGF